MPIPGRGPFRPSWAILGIASNVGEAVIARLPDAPNLLGTVFPGTGLRMVSQLPELARTIRQVASRPLQEP